MWLVPRKYMLKCKSALPHPAAHQFALPANLEGDQGGKSPRRSQFQILTTLKEELHHLLGNKGNKKEKQTLFSTTKLR